MTMTIDPAETQASQWPGEARPTQLIIDPADWPLLKLKIVNSQTVNWANGRTKKADRPNWRPGPDPSSGRILSQTVWPGGVLTDNDGGRKRTDDPVSPGGRWLTQYWTVKAKPWQPKDKPMNRGKTDQPMNNDNDWRLIEWRTDEARQQTDEWRRTMTMDRMNEPDNDNNQWQLMKTDRQIEQNWIIDPIDYWTDLGSEEGWPGPRLMTNWGKLKAQANDPGNCGIVDWPIDDWPNWRTTDQPDGARPMTQPVTMMTKAEGRTMTQLDNDPAKTWRGRTQWPNWWPRQPSPWPSRRPTQRKLSPIIKPIDPVTLKDIEGLLMIIDGQIGRRPSWTIEPIGWRLTVVKLTNDQWPTQTEQWRRTVSGPGEAKKAPDPMTQAMTAIDKIEPNENEPDRQKTQWMTSYWS